MLEFYHDCIVKYFNPNSFELTETDTDSIYMAINEENIDRCINDKYQKNIIKKFLTLVMILNILNGFQGDAVPLILCQESVRLGGLSLNLKVPK